MIRTRDFVLFVTALLFVFLGIGTTIAHDISDRAAVTPSADVQLSAHSGGPETVGVVVPETEPDRAARREALRKKLAARELISAPNDAPRTEVAPSAATTSSPATSTTASSSPRTSVERCSSYSASADEAWPVAAVELIEREGAMVLVSKRTAAVPQSASSTAASTTFTTLLQLPIPERQTNAACIDSPIVGVAFDGLPLRNDEANALAVFDQETLVGYARDGFPIYGRNDTTELDECGGALTPFGYRYYLSSERDQVLNCFVGEPVPLP